MVEIKEMQMDFTYLNFEDFLNSLAANIRQHLRVPVTMKRSEPRTGPMAPLPYYYIAEKRKKKIAGFVEWGSEEQVLFTIYPNIYGRIRGTSDLFCSVFDKRIEPIVIDSLQEFGDRFKIDTIYLAKVYE